jgi:hypothetical protein
MSSSSEVMLATNLGENRVNGVSELDPTKTADGKVLTKVKRRAYQLDMSLLNSC